MFFLWFIEEMEKGLSSSLSKYHPEDAKQGKSGLVYYLANIGDMTYVTFTSVLTT